jgi:hypothetical protein
MNTKGDWHYLIGALLLLIMDTNNCSVGFKPYKLDSFLIYSKSFGIYYIIYIPVFCVQMDSTALAGINGHPNDKRGKNEWTPQDDKINNSTNYI